MRIHFTRDDKFALGFYALVLLIIMALSMSGCIFWKPVVVVPHPDAPAMITEVRRRYYRTAVYEKTNNRLIDAGWTRIRPENLVGLTVSKFDWEAHIAKRGRNASDDE